MSCVWCPVYGVLRVACCVLRVACCVLHVSCPVRVSILYLFMIFVTSSNIIAQVSPGVYEIVKLGVDQTAQGKGVGKKLTMFCIEKARELNARKLELESHSSLKVDYKKKKKIIRIEK